MKEIKICKRAYIQQDTDRWGQLLGTYSVNYAVGFVSENLWEDMNLFENYGNTPETKAELEAAAEFIGNGGEVGEADLSIMNRLLKRSGSQLWQFNLRLDTPTVDDTSSYIRCIASFKVPSLFVHDESMDKEYEKLKLQVIEMNKKQVGNE